MDITEIMDITPENLAEKQEKALVKEVVDKLEEIIRLFKSGSYEKLEDHLCYSPAGDCMGTNNYFIRFQLSKDGEPLDLADVANRLLQLRGIHEKYKKSEVW